MGSSARNPKSRHLKRLIPHIPPQAGYIEAFAGGCALLLAKPKSRLEVVNDINGDLINLYRCASNHPGNQAHGPARHYSEIIVHSPGLR